MLAELALHCLTAASWPARRVGLVSESVGVWSRGRRCRREWAAHEERSRAVARDAMRALPRRRKAIVLGSGFLRDIPFDEMAETFEEIVLIDAAHPPQARRRARETGKASCATRDLTGALAWMMGQATGRADPVADLVADDRVDFVISANLLSQLPIRPEAWLEKRPRAAARLPARFADRMIGWHLDDLARFNCRVCLLADVVMVERDALGEALDEIDLMRGHALPPSDHAWDWMVAPIGELEPDRAYEHRVRGYVDFRRAIAAGPETMKPIAA